MDRLADLERALRNLYSMQLPTAALNVISDALREATPVERVCRDGEECKHWCGTSLLCWRFDCVSKKAVVVVWDAAFAAGWAANKERGEQLSAAVDGVIRDYRHPSFSMDAWADKAFATLVAVAKERGGGAASG